MIQTRENMYIQKCYQKSFPGTYTLRLQTYDNVVNNWMEMLRNGQTFSANYEGSTPYRPYAATDTLRLATDCLSTLLGSPPLDYSLNIHRDLHSCYRPRSIDKCTDETYGHTSSFIHEKEDRRVFKLPDECSIFQCERDTR